MHSHRFSQALKAIDAAHAEDPNKISVAGAEMPYELHYADKMTNYLQKRAPDASETLALAVRAQHFRRFEVPRSSYPMTKVGYHSWRSFLKKRQAEQAREICLECAYSDAEADRVASLIRKEDLKQDEETMALEDVACLVFLDDQFEDFEKSLDEEKIINILKKTWLKMSPQGRDMAQNMKMDGRPAELMQKALAG
ncbi:MAG: hypothetical protein Q9162_003841 [Coniocarpon cinnabarinum]